MIIEELFEINGTSHIRRYSDSGLMIASDDNIEYEVAEDLASIAKVYHETQTPVSQDEVTAQEMINKLEAIL